MKAGVKIFLIIFAGVVVVGGIIGLAYYLISSQDSQVPIPTFSNSTSKQTVRQVYTLFDHDPQDWLEIKDLLEITDFFVCKPLANTPSKDMYRFLQDKSFIKNYDIVLHVHQILTQKILSKLPTIPYQHAKFEVVDKLTNISYATIGPKWSRQAEKILI